MSHTLDIGILGADGRMGGAIRAALSDTDNTQLSAAVTAPNSPNLGADYAGITLHADVGAALDSCDVLIDFSRPRAAIDAALASHDKRCQAIVSGTTGFTPEEDTAFLSAAHSIALLRADNFSPGVNVLAALVRQAAHILDEGWDIEILDMHHRYKVDAPSGTALLFGRAAADGRGQDLNTVKTALRDGVTGERAPGEIGFAALRGGGIVGAHEVRLASDLEMITLSHDALDRSVFARGAIRAARWLHNKPKGLYGMSDVLGLGA